MVKVVDHDERRDVIAKAAIEVIASVGLEQAKLRVIATKAGVTTGAIAHYFKDKDAALFNDNANPEGKRIRKFVDVLPITDVNKRYWKAWLAFCRHASFSENIRVIYEVYDL